MEDSKLPTGLILSCTGHRPKSLGPNGYSYSTFMNLVRTAENAFTRLKPSLVIVGGALGWDQACAAAAHNCHIEFDVYFPFPGFDEKWPSTSQEEARLIHSYARRTIFVCDPPYEAWKMQRRNEMMVDDSQGVLALFNGRNGGTKNCVDYARMQQKKIFHCWDLYIKECSHVC